MKFEPDSFAGEIDNEEIDAVWDHLVTDEDFTPPLMDPSYRDFIYTYHGGKPLHAVFNGETVQRFLNFANPFYFETPDEIKHGNVNVVRSWIADRLPDNAIPFAVLPHGNYLCFLYKEGERPRVARWYHERSKPGNPHLEVVADNFNDFLKSLAHDRE